MNTGPDILPRRIDTGLGSSEHAIVQRHQVPEVMIMRVACRCILGAACLAMTACSDRGHSESTPKESPSVSLETYDTDAYYEDGLPAEELRQIAADILRVGIPTEKMHSAMIQRKVPFAGSTGSSRGRTFLFGTLNRPLLIVTTKRIDETFQVTKWEIEE